VLTKIADLRHAPRENLHRDAVMRQWKDRPVNWPADGGARSEHFGKLEAAQKKPGIQL